MMIINIPLAWQPAFSQGNNSLPKSLPPHRHPENLVFKPSWSYLSVVRYNSISFGKGHAQYPWFILSRLDEGEKPGRIAVGKS